MDMEYFCDKCTKCKYYFKCSIFEHDREATLKALIGSCMYRDPDKFRWCETVEVCELIFLDPRMSNKREQKYQFNTAVSFSVPKGMCPVANHESLAGRMLVPRITYNMYDYVEIGDKDIHWLDCSGFTGGTAAQKYVLNLARQDFEKKRRESVRLTPLIVESIEF